MAITQLSRHKFTLPVPLLVTCVNAGAPFMRLKQGERYKVLAIDIHGNADVRPVNSEHITIHEIHMNHFKQEPIDAQKAFLRDIFGRHQPW